MKRLLSCLAALALSATAGWSQTPTFEHLSKLVREQLPEVTAQAMDEAATKGLLASLKARVILVGTNGQPAAPLVATNRLFDAGLAYLRVNRIGLKLGSEIRTAVESMGALKGLVLDLRFANGFDYVAAGRTADIFLKDGGTLLEWEGGDVAAQSKDDALSLPLMVVINHQTRGAAEALAAVLRSSKAGLLVGSATAGEARLYREHDLPDGRKVRIASGSVRLAGGSTLPTDGVAPDIMVLTPAADERKYLEDPYRVLARSEEAGVSVTEVVSERRRINEAELVRMQREGVLDADEPLPPPDEKPARKPLVRDPALAAALDMLKALSIARPLLQP